MNDGTIGDGSSSATTRANDDCHGLFVLIWNGTLDTWCPVPGGRGASAEADWSAHKTITLPRALGRALAAAGSGSGLTSRALGEYRGEETHVLTIPEMPSHTHIQDPHTHTVAYASNPHTAGAAANNSISASGATTPSGSTTATNQSTGGDGAHNNMQPTLFLIVMVHL
jgi:microcystin-dependent protein